MYEIMRWVSLGTSLFALGFSCYSCWLSFGVNQRLMKENAKLRARCHIYEAEVSLLRHLSKKENDAEAL